MLNIAYAISVIRNQHSSADDAFTTCRCCTEKVSNYYPIKVKNATSVSCMYMYNTQSYYVIEILKQTFRRVDQSASYPVRDLTDRELVCRRVVLLPLKQPESELYTLHCYRSFLRNITSLRNKLKFTFRSFLRRAEHPPSS